MQTYDESVECPICGYDILYYAHTKKCPICGWLTKKPKYGHIGKYLNDEKGPYHIAEGQEKCSICRDFLVVVKGKRGSEYSITMEYCKRCDKIISKTESFKQDGKRKLKR